VNLRRLLAGHLRPYRRIIAVVVVLQALQTTATLSLPALSARIIDEGVADGDTGTIVRVGAVMLGLSLLQIVFAAGAVWFGSRAAMAFSRDVRRDLFHQVTAYSAREVGRFGAPSLITRLTNDVTQVQVLVGTGLTMLLAAPLTLVIGVALAIREDVGLSVVLAVGVPVMVVMMGSIVVRMVPAFQQMQMRIDQVNTVLREQITGIRVVRAFVREPEETARFSQANQGLTDTSLRAGRLMASLFPTVGLLVNLSSLFAIWIGGDEIGRGELQVGSLVAYLSYLTQVLMAVVMATFMVSMIPRAAVAGDRIMEVLDTPSSVEPPGLPVREVPEHGTIEFRDVSFRYANRDHRQHRCGQDDAREPDRPPLRRDRGHRPRQRRRRARARPRTAVGLDRLCAAEGVPVLRNGRDQPPLRPSRCDRRGAVGGARGGAGGRVRAVDARRVGQPDRTGRHQRVGWAAAAPVDRQGARGQTGHLRVRRLVLRARPRDRRPPARRARTAHA
jgi:ABC-type multidrug transport system fused ATPase/permease subunit